MPCAPNPSAIPTPTLTSSTVGLAASTLVLTSSETSSASPEPTSTPTAQPTADPTTPDRQGLPPKPPADGGTNGGAAAGGAVAGLTALGAAGAVAGAIIHHRNKKKNRVFDGPITLRQLEARVKAAQLPAIEEVEEQDS